MKTCIACGEEFERTGYYCLTHDDMCVGCGKRSRTWGRYGTIALGGIAKMQKEITVEQALNIINKYYKGESGGIKGQLNILKHTLKIMCGQTLVNGRHYSNGRHTGNQAQRNRVSSQLERDKVKKSQCEICGSSKTLHLHHILPASWGGLYLFPYLVITLCHSCHVKTHKRINKALNQERLAGYLKKHENEILELAKNCLPEKEC